MLIPFDPVERARKVESIVMDERGRRKYYRFRFAPYYGGIATADAMGCNLLCAYCWNYYRNLHPEKHGAFYSSQGVASKLVALAEKHGRALFRISGAEPVLGVKSAVHVVNVVDGVASSCGKKARFILETNGIMIGQSDDVHELLSGVRNLMVRISVKGWDEESFERISGAKGEYFHLQIEALRKLKESHVKVWPAVMFDVFGMENVQKLAEILKVSGFSLHDIELEYLEPYPFVERNMRRRGLI